MMLKIFKTTILPILVSSVEISKSTDKMSDKYETKNLSGGLFLHEFFSIEFFFEMTTIARCMISWPMIHGWCIIFFFFVKAGLLEGIRDGDNAIEITRLDLLDDYLEMVMNMISDFIQNEYDVDGGVRCDYYSGLKCFCIGLVKKMFSSGVQQIRLGVKVVMMVMEMMMVVVKRNTMRLIMAIILLMI